MKRCVRVDSYFSLPTDLAAEFRSWPEFVSGSGYEVQLRSSSDESVAIRYQETEDGPRMTIESIGEGELFERVIGRALYALSAHSDTVCIHRDSEEPIQPPQRNAGGRPSSDDSSASGTPSSFGPRGSYGDDIVKREADSGC